MLTRYKRRKFRVRNKVINSNLSGRNRITIYRSNKHTYLQALDINGNVLKSFSTLNLKLKDKVSGLEKADLIGQSFSKICCEAGIKDVVFDRSGYTYSGRIKAVADACRKSGLKF